MSKSAWVIREGFIEEVMLEFHLIGGSARKGHFRKRGQHIKSLKGMKEDTVDHSGN